VRWHPSFAALKSLHGRLAGIDIDAVRTIFGPLINGIQQAVRLENGHV